MRLNGFTIGFVAFTFWRGAEGLVGDTRWWWALLFSTLILLEDNVARRR